MALAYTGRGIKQNLTKKQVKDRLNADNGLMKERLKEAGYGALNNIITAKKMPKTKQKVIMEALIQLRNQWLLNGYEDKREVEKEFGTGVNALPTKRGYLGNSNYIQEVYKGHVPKRNSGNKE